MKLSMSIEMLFWGSALLSLLLSWLATKQRPTLALQQDEGSLKRLIFGLLCIIPFYGLAFLLQGSASQGFLLFLGSFCVWLLLSRIQGIPGLQGILMLLGLSAYFHSVSDLTTLPTPLLSLLFGITLGHFLTAKEGAWKDYLLPAASLIGSYWITIASPEALQTTHYSLLSIALSITLLLRGLQPFLQTARFSPAALPWMSSLGVTLLGGLGTWFAIQTLLLQPTLVPWAILLAGSIALGFALSGIRAMAFRMPLLSALSQLILIGIATLVASRLFGTLGWIVVAVGLLTPLPCKASASSTASTPSDTMPGLSLINAMASLFLLSRVLLQGFIYQYNPNVTGINVTHPYASAAMYGGIILMLIVPAMLNATNALATKNNKSLSPIMPMFGATASVDTEETPFAPNAFPWAMISLVAVFSSLFTNYFLHAEAAGSFLVALTTGAIDISILGAFQCASLRYYPSFLALLAINAALLMPELLETGNIAEKSQKLIILGVAFVLVLLLTFTLYKTLSTRKPVQVA